jgi:hypothetical protein
VGELARARQSIGPALRSALIQMGLAPMPSEARPAAEPALETEATART